MRSMEIIRTISRLRELHRELARQDLTLGFVPTMGALHEGHLNLMRTAKTECDRVVVSIFVNPMQFAPNEDFARYPRDPEGDARLCAGAGADFAYLPEVETVYPKGFRTYIEVEGLGKLLEGVTRPDHFRGVTTVVAKLLNQVQPDGIYLGQKDAQQAVILTRMVRDMDLPVEVRVCPTVREKDGLAMSSRNAFLTPEERSQATVLYKSLQKAESLILNGETEVISVLDGMRETISLATCAKIDYLSIVEADELLPVPRVEGRVLILLAVWFGRTRLIDNMLLTSEARQPK